MLFVLQCCSDNFSKDKYDILGLYFGNNSLVCEFINMKLLICYSTTNLFSGTLNINGNDLLFFMRVFFSAFVLHIMSSWSTRVCVIIT